MRKIRSPLGEEPQICVDQPDNSVVLDQKPRLWCLWL